MSNDAEQAGDVDADAETAVDGADDAATAGGHADSLAVRVREHDDELGDEVADLEARVEELEADLEAAEAEVEDLTDRLRSKQADFKNYKQRAKQRQEDIRERATEDLVERLLDVRDNLGRALEEESGDVDSLREGVKLTRKEFDRVLDAEGVSEIAPAPGDDVDAKRHEVMMTVDSDEPEGTVADVYRPGYEMGGKVLRAAQVAASDGANHGDAADGDDADDGTGNGDAGGGDAGDGDE
ncbi:nucleotide exchange factor GrpE [Halobacterium sp. PCN9]|uniref:Protein GrpE n=1 Tax=Halobacterium bonnevillei TaxID=2692200 RepID=A0A6B0SMT4_9EURY|nr:nucleotide exchange factor GrpE [Halobacterium bonnevillei]